MTGRTSDAVGWPRVLRFWVILVAFGLMGSACTDRSTGAESTPSSLAEDTALAPVGSWESERTIDLPKPKTSFRLSEGGPVEPAGLHIVDGAWLVTGSYLGIPTIWRSENRVDWDVAHFDDKDGVRGQWVGLAVFGDQVVAALNGGDRSFLYVSDRGRTWQVVDSPLFANAGSQVRGLFRSDDSLIVDMGSRPASRRPAFSLHRSVDAVNWDPVALPDPVADPLNMRMSSDGRNRFVAQADEVRGDRVFGVFWVTDDGGRTFDRLELEEQPNSFAVLARTLVVRSESELAASPFGSGLPGGSGVWVHDGSEWRRTEMGLDRWAHPGARFDAVAFDPTSDRLYAVVTATPVACFESIVDCDWPGQVLVSSADGLSWSKQDVRLDGRGQSGPLSTPALVASAGELVVWRYEPTRVIAYTRWTSAVPPRLAPAAGAESASTQTPVWDGETLNSGDEYRYPWLLRPCPDGEYVGVIELNDEVWTTGRPLTVSDWPTKNLDGESPTSAMAFGRIRLEAPGKLSFVVEGQGVVATLQPGATQEDHFCA